MTREQYEWKLADYNKRVEMAVNAGSPYEVHYLFGRIQKLKAQRKSQPVRKPRPASPMPLFPDEDQ